MPVPVILDTDLAMGEPGSEVDDGFALVMALADPGIDLRLITTVYGNTDVDSATTLSSGLLRRLDRESVPVVRGADRALGAGATTPNPAVDAMIDLVLADPHEITLVPIGPLTNVALAIRLEPRFAPALAQLVIMGGVFSGGPVRPEMPGEFNVWNDPEAAQVVLDAPVTARWVGLDVTRRVRLGRDEAVEMAASRHPFEAFAGAYTVGWIDHLAATPDEHGHPDEDPGSCPLHDPLAVAVVTRPELVRFVPARLRVGVGTGDRGMMTVAGSPPNALVGRDVDVAAFRAHFASLMAR